jgi:hypothetical protein
MNFRVEFTNIKLAPDLVAPTWLRRSDFVTGSDNANRSP